MLCFIMEDCSFSQLLFSPVCAALMSNIPPPSKTNFPSFHTEFSQSY